MDRRYKRAPGPVQNGWQPVPNTRQRIDDAVRCTVSQGFERATGLLQERRDMLERCARALLQHETLDADALRTLAGLPDPALPAPEEPVS